MKNMLLILPLMLASHGAHAVVADQFHCKLEIYELGTDYHVEQEADFSIARLPQSTNPGSGVYETNGNAGQSFKFATANGTMTASFNINYNHAVRLSDARQMTCIAVSTGYCAKGTKFCTSGMGICSQSSRDPFDPVNGWTEVDTSAGFPAFDQGGMGPTVAKILDGNNQQVGTFHLKCDNTGTLN